MVSLKELVRGTRLRSCLTSSPVKPCLICLAFQDDHGVRLAYSGLIIYSVLTAKIITLVNYRYDSRLMVIQGCENSFVLWGLERVELLRQLRFGQGGRNSF